MNFYDMPKTLKDPEALKQRPRKNNHLKYRRKKQKSQTP